MAAISPRFGSGGANLVPNAGAGSPTLADALRDMADDLAASPAAQTPAWATGITVSSNSATLPDAGWVVAVHATAGTATGPKSMIQTGSPAAGQVRIDYAASGIPTLVFNGTDAITATAVVQIKRTASYSLKTSKAT